MGTTRKVGAHLVWLVAVSANLAGCSDRGASGLSDRLMWTANRMSLLKETERTVTYVHDHELPYWIVAAPPGTSPDTVTDSLPSHAVPMVANCLRTGKTVFAVIDETAWGCMQSETSFPQILKLMTVAKRTGESTTFVIGRTATGLELISMN